MEILRLDAGVFKIGGKIFRHLFCKGCDKHTLAYRNAFSHLADEVVNLIERRPHLDGWIDKSGWAQHLLDDPGAGFHLVIGRRRGYKHDLIDAFLEFTEIKGAVVERGGQPESILNEIHLARSVALEHAADLRNGDMRFIDEHDVIALEIIEKACGRFAGLSAPDDTGIIFDAAAVTHLQKHFHVVARSAFKALRLYQFALRVEYAKPFFKLFADKPHCFFHLFGRGYEVLCGVNIKLLQFLGFCASQGIDAVQAFDRVAEKFDSECVL